VRSGAATGAAPRIRFQTHLVVAPSQPLTEKISRHDWDAVESLTICSGAPPVLPCLYRSFPAQTFAPLVIIFDLVEVSDVSFVPEAV
jgi:hypothetical protein